MSAATVVGTVQDVRGSTVSVVLNDNNVSGLSFVDGLTDTASAKSAAS